MVEIFFGGIAAGVAIAAGTACVIGAWLVGNEDDVWASDDPSAANRAVDPAESNGG